MPTLEPTLQSQVLANNYRFLEKYFLSLSLHWLIIVVNVGKVVDKDLPELDCFVQLRRALRGNVWSLVGRFDFTTVTSN